MADITKTLKERGRVYGDFERQAKIGQSLKHTMALQTGWLLLADDQREAVEMICTKLARIVNGSPDYLDNWVDIEGYARLVAKRLEKKK
jgi:hypothetical protein